MRDRIDRRTSSRIIAWVCSSDTAMEQAAGPMLGALGYYVDNADR